MFKISQLHHVSFLVTNTTRAVGFYRDVLGLAVDISRPDLGYAGAWLQLGNMPNGGQIHLLELPNPDPREGRPAHGGHDRHVAFAMRDLDELMQRLKQHHIAYTLSRSRRALFCRDPDGNALEFIELA